jgi:hypothetical protein
MRRQALPLSVLLLLLFLLPWPAAAADREVGISRDNPSALTLFWRAAVDRVPVLSVFEKLGPGMDPWGQPTVDLGPGMDPAGQPTVDLGPEMDPFG